MPNFNFDPKKIYFRISKAATKINGSSAQLSEENWYCAYDIMCTLLLPSGNDSALVMAENFGRFLLFDECRFNI